ncbi:MAG: HigA family addiction module antitoxin [Hyphomicrobiales bacterium]|jgi:addiction module HigA family antidote
MSEHTTDNPSCIHPGVLLLEEFLKPLGISQNRLARDIDVPVSRIAAIVAGQRAITADTAMRLSAYFDTKPELWMKLQAAYEIAVLRTSDWPRIEARIRPYEPIDEPQPARREGEAQMPQVDDFRVTAVS